jgi:hypothetical protein
LSRATSACSPRGSATRVLLGAGPEGALESRRRTVGIVFTRSSARLRQSRTGREARALGYARRHRRSPASERDVGSSAKRLAPTYANQPPTPALPGAAN